MERELERRGATNIGTSRRPEGLASGTSPKPAGRAPVRSARAKGEPLDEMLKRLRRDLSDDVLERACQVVLRSESPAEPQVVIARFPDEVQIIIGERPDDVRIIIENGRGTPDSRPSNGQPTVGPESLWQRSSRWVRNRWRNARE